MTGSRDVAPGRRVARGHRRVPGSCYLTVLLVVRDESDRSRDRCRPGHARGVRARARAARPDDPRREARPARRLLARPERRPSRRCRARWLRARSPRATSSEVTRARPRPLHAGLRHPAGRPGRAGRLAVGRAAPAASARRGSASPRSSTRSASPGSPPGRPPPSRLRSPGVPSFDPDLVAGDGARPSATRCGSSASTRASRPVLDVIRDPRWGRVDECIGEDPYLVGTIGTAYVRGLQDAGRARDAQALRRLLGSPAGPQPRAGPRRPARDRRRASCRRSRWRSSTAAARSVMNSYADIDGVPVAAERGATSPAVLREQLGLRRRRRRGLLRRRVPRGHARRRGRPRRGRRARARGRHRHRAADRRRLPAAARRSDPRRARSTRPRRPGRAARARAEGGARACSTPTRSRTSRPPTIDLDSPAPPRARPPPRRGVRRAAVERRRAAAQPAPGALVAGRGHRPQRRIAPRRSWAATRSPTTCWPTTPSCRSASRSRRCSRRSPARSAMPGWPCRNSSTPRAAPSRATTRPASPRRSTPRASADVADRRRRRPGRPLRPRHGRRGQRLGVPRAARRAARARRGGRRDRHARRHGAAHRPPVRDRLGARRRRARAGRGAAGVLPRRGRRPGDRRHPHRARSTRPGGCPSRCRARPARSRTPTCTRSSAARRTSRRPTRRRCCPFGFGLSYTSFEYSDLVVDPRRWRGGTFTAAVTVTNTGAVRGADTVQLYGHDVQGSVTRPVAQLLGLHARRARAGRVQRA